MSVSVVDDARSVEVRSWMHFPYGCAALVAAHAECVAQRGWQRCDQQRAAMDDCVEAAERARFRMDAQCSRVKRMHQSCLLHVGEGSDCTDIFNQLYGCYRDARQ